MTPQQRRQQRADQLARTFAQLEALRADAERWQNWTRVDALKRTMALLDAIECIEQRAAPFACEQDTWIVGRLREIAIARDIFGERAKAETQEAVLIADKDGVK